jgi:predicted esterase
MKHLVLSLLAALSSLTHVFGQASIIPQPINQSRATWWQGQVSGGTSQYEAWLYTRVVSQITQRLPFRMLKPVNYNLPANASKKYPLIIMLHGRGEAGTDNNFQLQHFGLKHLEAVNNAADPGYVGTVKFDGFVVFPQEPNGYWANQPEFNGTQLTTALSQVLDLVDSLANKYRIDRDHVVIHGLSAGGTGTWAALYNRPDLFCCALPMSAPGDVTQMSKVAPIPIWLFQGALDTNPIPYISQQVIAALRAAGAVDDSITRYTEYPNTVHNTWDKVYLEPDFYPYILRQKKTKVMPLSRIPRCPGEVSTLGISPSLSDYQWYQNNVPMVGATTNTITNLPLGSYHVRFKRKPTDVLYLYSDTVTITQDPAAPKPTIQASGSVILPSPSASNVTLSAPADYDEYEWSNGATTKQITTNISGIYTLRVRASGECWSLKSDTVQVKAAPMVAPIPAMPTGLTATPISQTSVSVGWLDNATNETGYEIYRSTQANSGYQFVKLVAANSTSYTDISATPSTGYYYKVRSVNKQAATLSSTSVYVETPKDATVPGIPASFAFYSINAQGLRFNWRKSVDQFPIKRYIVYTGDLVLGYATDTTFVFPQMSPGTSYMFSVEAEDYSGNKSGKSNILPWQFTGQGLFAAAYEGAYNNLPNFANLTPVREGYTNLSELISTTTSFNINALTGEKIHTVDDGFSMRYTGYIQILRTGTWTFYTNSDEGSKLFINNTQVVNNDGLHSYRERSGTYNFTQTGWFPIRVEYFDKTGGQRLNIQWRGPGSTNPNKEVIPINRRSLFSSGIVSIIPAPVALNTTNFTGLFASNVLPVTDKFKNRLSLVFSSAPHSSLKGFEIYRFKSGTGSPATGASTPTRTSAWVKIRTVPITSSASTITVIDSMESEGVYLSNNTRYYYAVRFYNDFNVSTSPDFYFEPINTGSQQVKDNVVCATTSNITLSGTMTIDGVPVVNGNRVLVKNQSTASANGIYICNSGGGWSRDGNLNDGFEFSKFSVVVTSGTVNQGTIWHYNNVNNPTVGTTAINLVSIGVLTPSTAITAPAVPTLTAATGVSNTIVSLNFTDNSSNESGFELWRSQGSGGFFNLVGVLKKNSSTYVDSSGAVNTSYTYKIRAYNQGGFSAYSNELTASTLNIPNAPSNLKVAVVGPKHVNITWQNNSANSGFGISIYRSAVNKNTGFVRIDSVANPGMAFYQDTSIALSQKFYYKVRAYNSVLSTFSNVDSSSVYQALGPFTGDWKMPVTDVVTNFRTYAGATAYTRFNNNRAKLKTDLLAKKDFLRHLYIAKDDSGFFAVKIPHADSIPQGGLLTFLLSVAQNVSYASPSPNHPDTARLEDGLFSDLCSQYVITVSTSNDNVTYTPMSPQPHMSDYNHLQKIDITPAMANKWVKVNIRHTSLGNFCPNTKLGYFVSEIGAYRFRSGVRHNYFLLLGASLERPTPISLNGMQIKRRTDVAGLTAGESMLIFNLCRSGTNSTQLRNELPDILARHPKAEYVIVHQGGNDINNPSQLMRPLTYNKLKTLPNAQNLINNYQNIIQQIQNAGKLPLISRLHFRDYRDYCSDGSIPAGTASNNITPPATWRGRNQENGSLPVNLLIDSLTKLYTPYAYNYAERRSHLNYYPITLNRQWMISSDGIHMVEGTIDRATDYWVNYPIRYVYTGQFGPAVDYNPDNQLQATTAYCGLQPANKLNLASLTLAAVQKAERTKSGEDIWEARILVEQTQSRATRVDYINRLDSLRDYRSPANPTALAVNIVDGSTLQLTWLDNDIIETSYQVWKSNNGGTTYKLAASLPANTSSHDVTGLAGDTVYTFYVRAVNGNFESGWSNVVSESPSVTFFSKATGDLNSLSTWGRLQDGTGAAPGSFGTSGQSYYLANRPNETVLSNAWNVSGLFTKIILGTNTKLTAENGLSGKVDLMAGSQLVLKTSTIPTFNYIDSTSSITFGNSATLVNNAYGKLILNNAGTKTFTQDTVRIKGDLVLDSNIVVQGHPTVLMLDGNLLMTDSMPVLQNISVVLNKNIHMLDGKGGSITLGSLRYKQNANVFVQNGSKLKLGNATGGGFLPETNSTLYLNNGQLHILNNGALNPENNLSALIASTTGSVLLNTSSADTSYLYPAKFANTFTNLTHYSVGGLSLEDSMMVLNTLKLGNGKLYTKDSLVLASTVFGTARIAKVENSASLVGKVYWQRTVGPYKSESYYYLGFPIKDKKIIELKKYLTLRGFQPGQLARTTYWYEPTGVWRAVSDSNYILSPGKGFRFFIDSVDIRYGDSSAFYELKGEPVIGNGTGNSAGTFSIALSNNGGGWNQISNPYPCEIDWKSTAITKTNVRNCYYMWDGNRKSYKVYCSPGAGAGESSTAGMTSIINAGQGFFVKATGISSSITFTESAKRSDTIQPSFYRMESTPQIRVNLRNEKYESDEVLVRFYSEASPVYDQELDAFKYNGSGINLASIAGTDRLTINTLPSATALTIVPLHVQASKAGKYYLDFTEVESFDQTSQIYLQDNELGVQTDLRKSYSYAFEQSKSFDNKTRFALVFKNTGNDTPLGNALTNETSQWVSVAPNPAHDHTTFTISLENSQEVTLIVLNQSGLLVHSRSILAYHGQNEIRWNLRESDLPAGMYHYKVKAENKEFKGKIIVH